MSNANLLKEMPFYGLSDFQLKWENESCKNHILEKMNNNGFIDFISNSQLDENNTFDINQCRYYDMDEYNRLLKDRDHLNIIHINCRMFSANRGKIFAFLSSLDKEMDVILLSEIGKEGYKYLYSTFPNYDYEVNLPTKNSYGGVAIVTKSELKLKLKTELLLEKECDCRQCQFESVWVEIQYMCHTILIGCTYRHPNGKIEHFIEQYSKILEKLPNDSTCIIGGDINIDLLNINHKEVLSYITELSSYNFFPRIMFPTRITDNTSTLIDHIFLKLSKRYSDAKIMSGNIFAEITDHLPIFIGISFKVERLLKRPLIRIINEQSLHKFKEKCSSIDWTSLGTMQHIDAKFDFLQDNLVQAFNESFPLVQKSRKRAKDKKWITHGLKISIRHKNRLYKRKILSPTPHNKNKFKEYNMLLQESIKSAEENYYKALFNDTKDSSIKMWRALGSIINPNKKTKQNHIAKIITENGTFVSSEEISNQINNYFCTIGSKLASSIPNGNSFEIYLKNRVNQTMFLSPISESEISREINKLNNRKCPGPDNISPKILKACEPELRKPLTDIFNYSIETVTYPSKLKIAKVIALHKKKSIFYPENYRPISLLSCLDKIFEKLIHKRLMEFINKYKIIIWEQFGFLKKHSTMLALIDVIDNVRGYINQGEYALGIFLDLKKAFDTVGHSILLSKLEHYGIRGHVNEFLKSYLMNRQQYTMINGSASITQSISIGVPQGSVLGPLFFLLYINDIINCLSHSKPTLFADDTSLLLHDKNLKTVIELAENDLKNTYDWLVANQLSLSWEKTNFIIFHSPKKKIDNVTDLKVYENSIKRVKSVKYLGMCIDEELKWDEHVNNLCSTLSRNFSMFYSIRSLLTDDLKRQLYFSMVYSRILYGIVLYGMCRNTLLNKVQVIQNKLLKVLYKLPTRTDTDLLHSNLNFLKVKDICKFQIQIFVYESINKTCIPQFQNYYSFLQDYNEHRMVTRHRDQLYRTPFSNQYGEFRLKRYGAVLWNSLSNSIKNSQSLKTFKKALRSNIMDTYQI